MAIRVRKIKNKNATGGFSYIALCAAKNKYKRGDLYLNDSIDHALRMKFLSDYIEEGMIMKMPLNYGKGFKEYDNKHRIGG